LFHDISAPPRAGERAPVAGARVFEKFVPVG